MTTPHPSQLLKLTGLWVSETKAGRKMLSGEIRPGLKLLAPHQKQEQQDTPPTPEAF